MRCSRRTFARAAVLVTAVAAVSLLAVSTAVAGPPEQARAKLPYDAGVARFEVVDESQPFDPLHGIMVRPRILVGVVYYPVKRRAAGCDPIRLSYYHDAPEFESYSRTIEWAFKFVYPDSSGHEILESFGSSVDAHLNTVRDGIYADAPIARGPFPVVVQFNGSAGRGHQADDVGKQFARRGYIYVALDAPGVSSLTPVGRVDLADYDDLKSALGALDPCKALPAVPFVCFNKEPGEYGVVDDGTIVWGPPDFGLKWETYEIQRARDAVAMLEKVETVFGRRVDTRRVGIIGISLGAPSALVAPQLIDALRGLRGDRYAAYGIVPTPFAVNMIGEADWFGHEFGSEIGGILCGGAPACDPFEAARQFDFPVGIHIAEEDRLITGFPDSPPESAGAEWILYDWYPGYGPGLTPAPSPENRSPANRILFESIAEGVPALRVQVPDADHLNFVSNPFFRLFDDFVLDPPIRVFPPNDLYEPLPMELQQEILVHYAAAFFDLTLKEKRGSLGALKTGRYRHVTPDGRGVTVEARSLEARPD